MSNSDEARWIQRFEKFEKSLAELKDVCDLEEYSNIERAGLIKIFELTFELSWKVLKDLLYIEGYSLRTPREVFRQSFESSYLSEDDCETFLIALRKRNELSHVYDEEMALEAKELIKNVFHPALISLYQTLKQVRSE